MTRKQLDKYLNVVKRHLNKHFELENGLRRLFHSEVEINVGDEILTGYISLVEKLCGDEGENISWYIFDNNFGKNKRSKNGKVIDNTRKLLNLIEGENQLHKPRPNFYYFNKTNFGKLKRGRNK